MTQGAYAGSFERFAVRLPAAERAARGLRLQQFLAAGFPRKHEEDWRYTDLSVLAAKTFELAEGAGTAPSDAFIDATDRLVFVDGRYDAANSTAGEFCGNAAVPQADSTDGLRALNAAFAGAGLDLRLAPGICRQTPLHVVCIGQSGARPLMSHQHHRIALGEGAEATVILDFSGRGDGEYFSTHTLDIELAANARLSLYRIQDQRTSASLLTRFDARLAREARLESVCFDTGGGLVRHDFNVSLDGRGAEAELHGLYVPQPHAHIDNHTRIIHAATHGRSREHFRGILAERTRAVFAGKVVVRQGAQKTDSEQPVAHLLLARNAEVDAKPDLEIYADDVKCAHGATVGQLDEAALSYLRSRGVDAVTAKALLLRAFAAEVLGHVRFEPLRRPIEPRLRFPSDGLDEFEESNG